MSKLVVLVQSNKDEDFFSCPYEAQVIFYSSDGFPSEKIFLQDEEGRWQIDFTFSEDASDRLSIKGRTMEELYEKIAIVKEKVAELLRKYLSLKIEKTRSVFVFDENEKQWKKEENKEEV